MIHLQNIHEGHSDIYPKCLHGNLGARDWFDPGKKLLEFLFTWISFSFHLSLLEYDLKTFSRL